MSDGDDKVMRIVGYSMAAFVFASTLLILVGIVGIIGQMAGWWVIITNN